jgi:hypothetical protein
MSLYTLRRRDATPVVYSSGRWGRYENAIMRKKYSEEGVRDTVCLKTTNWRVKYSCLVKCVCVCMWPPRFLIFSSIKVQLGGQLATLAFCPAGFVMISTLRFITIDNHVRFSDRLKQVENSAPHLWIGTPVNRTRTNTHL